MLRRAQAHIPFICCAQDLYVRKAPISQYLTILLASGQMAKRIGETASGKHDRKAKNCGKKMRMKSRKTVRAINRENNCESNSWSWNLSDISCTTTHIGKGRRNVFRIRLNKLSACFKVARTRTTAQRTVPFAHTFAPSERWSLCFIFRRSDSKWTAILLYANV